ncbi:cation channel sperm-associated protein subunit epsilon isoform X5 [Gallus gallus]|uniref:cation channel sperm-associated protein subunit epsilon isoform X5 n=1 Tax=Gallus gallus TaxID=9031 RepID=UPI001F0106E2|nr:cation channel sperm-associated protein subunit epsilon isoform X5 [Gallus gallus]
MCCQKKKCCHINRSLIFFLKHTNSCLSFTYELILWIYDPESADASELNHTAVFLSESSQILSKLLWIWGQKPVGQTYFKLKTFHSERLPKFSTCYKREARHVFTLGAEHKLPESEILGMHSRCWCSTVCPVQSGKQLSTLAAQMSTELYGGYSEAFNKIADTVSLVKILDFPNTASLTVRTVSCDSVPSEVTVLLICKACSSSRLFSLVFYNEDIQPWSLGDFYLPAPQSSAMRMIYINSALSSGLLWDDVFTTPIKTAQIMNIFMCLDRHYQKCLMGALSTRLFLVSHFFVGCPPGRNVAVEIPDVSTAEFHSFITLSILLACTTFCYRYSLTWKSETLGGFPQNSDKT